MTYQEALAWLYSTQQFGIKLGLENTLRLLAGLGDPQDVLKIFHVAGTNGKGSVCAMLDSVLRRAGHPTGLYTSPHLVDFRERIRVDGTMISKADAASGLTRVRELSANWDHVPTFFEICTALALRHFADAGCEYVVLETGMGGRLDATNAVEPIVSVLTPIGFDHMEWLGDTLAKIAGEKAGIIKPGVPAVSAPQLPETREVFLNRARQVGSPMTFVEEPWPGAVGLAGSHQKWNAALAATALSLAGLEIPPDHLAAGLSAVVWPGRFHRLGPKIIVDGAHNPHAMERLVDTWRSEMGDLRPLVIFGALRDKDVPGMLRQLDMIAAAYHFVPVQSARGADPSTFAEWTERPHRLFETLEAAVRAAGNFDGPLLFTGSLFLAGEVLAFFGEGNRDGPCSV
ncbi:MAG: folylpolyglutamate synthase/dihydrofolate synthase family protein [Terrimicrobiaceae bacterium]|nr:folylpolyglutamate synthase/dihydrofolate synthase family protein [Terrimicrobiaceae bacterium]